MAAPPTAHHGARLGDHPHGGGLPDYMGWYPARTCDCRVRQWHRRPGPRGPARGLAARYLTIVGPRTYVYRRPCACRPRAQAVRSATAGRLSSPHVRRVRCLRVHRRALPHRRSPFLTARSRPTPAGTAGHLSSTACWLSARAVRAATASHLPRLSRAQAAAPAACANHHRQPLAWQAARVFLTSVAHEGFR